MAKCGNRLGGSSLAKGRARRESRRRPFATRAPAVALSLVTLALAALVTGCDHAGKTVEFEVRPSHEAREAVARVNSNLSRIDRALDCRGIVSLTFNDTNGRTHRFIANPTVIIVEQPRCLYFDVKSIAGSIGRMGSNDDAYWMWVTAGDTRKMWWGTWAALDQGRARRVAVNPRQLLDAWLIGPIPEKMPDGTKPLLVESTGERRLIFPVLDKDGYPSLRREIFLDLNPPHMPVRIVDRRADGEVYMDARLSNYVRLDSDPSAGPYTAREYKVVWPLGGAKMDLSLDRVRYRTKEEPFCEFDPAAPGAFDGDVETLDESAPRRVDPELGETS